MDNCSPRAMKLPIVFQASPFLAFPACPRLVDGCELRLQQSWGGREPLRATWRERLDRVCAQGTGYSVESTVQIEATGHRAKEEEESRR